MPSDHFVSNQCQFISAIKNSLLGLNDRALFLFGIEAKKFSSEFGYIQLKSQDSLEVKTFIEKPSSSKIKYDLNGKNYFCNSGIFVFEGNWYVDQLNKIEKRFLDNISLAIDQGTRRKNLFYLNNSGYKNLKDISFDKGFTEKCKKVKMIKLEAGWSDMGSWAALRNTDLILDKNFGFKKSILKNKIERPWGFFKVLMEESNSKVKLIKVMPQQKLSLQKHKHRSETWHVIKGKAKVTRSSEKFTLEIGDSIEILKNQVHSMENIGDSPLEIIEIQVGEYLGEDDIVRIEDIYGRADLH